MFFITVLDPVILKALQSAFVVADTETGAKSGYSTWNIGLPDAMKAMYKSHCYTAHIAR
jgi:hypothetical protein